MQRLKTYLLALLLATLPAMHVHAADMGPGEAAERVQQQHGGRVLAVETIQRNGKTFYRIKILTGKGVVKVVTVNASR